MKRLFSLLFLLPFSCALFAQQGNGFTNKAEAKNIMVGGLKVGQWVEYFNVKNRKVSETKSKHAQFYRLTVYSAGKATGIVRDYFENRKLWCETPYVNGMVSGIQKMYDTNGVVVLTDTISDGKESGVIHVFYPSGSLKMDFPFVNDTANAQMVINFEPRGAIHIGMEKEPTMPYGLRGIANGVFKMYYETGKVKLAITYARGKEKAAKSYDENGREVK